MPDNLSPTTSVLSVRVNPDERAVLEAAAEQSHGKFYTLATAERLARDLQVGNRVTVSSSGPPTRVWNNVLFFLIALLLLLGVLAVYQGLGFDFRVLNFESLDPYGIWIGMALIVAGVLVARFWMIPG